MVRSSLLISSTSISERDTIALITVLSPVPRPRKAKQPRAANTELLENHPQTQRSQGPVLCRSCSSLQHSCIHGAIHEQQLDPDYGCYPDVQKSLICPGTASFRTGCSSHLMTAKVLLADSSTEMQERSKQSYSTICLPPWIYTVFQQSTQARFARA